jgi:hypothetical protein
MTSATSIGPKASRSRRRGRELIIVDLGHPTMMPGSACEVAKAKEDKQNDRCYHKTGERPDRDWTGRPGRSPR